MFCFKMRIMTQKIAFHCLQWSSHLYQPFRIHSFHFKLCIYFLCMSPRHPRRHFTSLTRGKKTRKTTPPLKVISRKTTTVGRLMMEKQFDNKRQQYIYGWRDKNEEYGGSIGSLEMCFQVFRFSIFYGFFFSCCCFLHLLLVLMMLPFGCAAIWYLKLLSLLFAEFFICIEARSRWYLRQSAIWVFCFCLSHSLLQVKKFEDKLTSSFDNSTILCHCSSLKVLWY